MEKEQFNSQNESDFQKREGKDMKDKEEIAEEIKNFFLSENKTVTHIEARKFEIEGVKGVFEVLTKEDPKFYFLVTLYENGKIDYTRISTATPLDDSPTHERI